MLYPQICGNNEFFRLSVYFRGKSRGFHSCFRLDAIEERLDQAGQGRAGQDKAEDLKILG